MITFTPSGKEQTSEIFQFNAGIDSINDPAFLGKGKVVDMINMEMNDYGPISRQGVTVNGNSTTGSINAEGVLPKESGDIRVRVDGTKFQKLLAGTWTDVVTGLTSMKATLISYICSDLTTAAVGITTTAGTISSAGVTASSGRIVTVGISGTYTGNMTINEHSGKTLRVISGTGAGQEMMITGNDMLDIFIESPLETDLTALSSIIEIREVAPHIIFTNGTDTPFKWDGTTKTNLTAWKKFHTIDVVHDRLFGAREDLDYVYVSNLGTEFFPKDNYIPVNQNGDIITNISRNHEEVSVYKQNSRYRITGSDLDTFQLVTADEKIGCIARHSVAHGNNYNFFLGYEGVFSINSLNNASTDEGIPISKDITNLILAHSAAEIEAAEGWMDNNKYHLSIGNDVFVYHIAQSQVVKSHCWTRYQYADPVKAAFVYGGEVYLGGVRSYTEGGTSDNGTVITCTVITGDRTQKDKNRNKIYHRDLINFSVTDTTVEIYVGVDGATPTLQASFNTATEGQMRMMVNKRARKIRYKYVFPGTHLPEMQTHETFFSYLSKAV